MFTHIINEPFLSLSLFSSIYVKISNFVYSFACLLFRLLIMTLRSSYPIYLSYQWNVFKLQISENLGFWNYNYIYLYHFNFYCSTIKFNFLTILTKASPYCSLCCQGNKIAFIVYKNLSNWYTSLYNNDCLNCVTHLQIS